MNITILGPEQAEELDRLRNYAERHRLDIDVFLDMMNGEGPPDVSEEYLCMIPINTRVVFTIEEQPSGTYRHLSMSEKGNLPNIFIVPFVMEKLGFKKGLMDCIVKVEDDSSCVHIMEIYD